MPSPPKPATASRLSRDGILDAYIGLADREGPEAVSLRRLGSEMGVDPTAVYRHFRDKDELLEAVADRLLNELADRHVRRDDWRDDLRQVAIEGRSMYFSHPRLARVIAASPEPSPGNARIIEMALADLRQAGLSEAEAALAYEAFATYIAGGSSLDAGIGSEANEAWRRRFASLDADAFPNAVAVARYLYQDEESAFMFGLELMFDGLEAHIRRRGGTP